MSIALSLIEVAEEAAKNEKAARVTEVHVALGALSGVVPEALLFSFDVAARGTLLEGSRLEIERLPAVIYCESCEAERELASIQAFVCPACGKPSDLVVGGREMELKAIEVEP